MQTYTPKNRTFRYKAQLFLTNTYKNFTRSSTSHKYIMISVILGTVGLLLPWVSTDEASYNSFSLICGFSGYTFAATYVFSIFAITQNKKKRELKNSLKLHVNDYSILLFSGAYITLGSFLLFFSFLGYKSDIGGVVTINTFSSGIIFEIFAGCILCFGGYLHFMEQKDETLKRMHIQNANISASDRENYDAILSTGKEDKNMKLPI